MGWSDGTGTPTGVDLADSSGSGETSLTLVQVQLFRGRDVSVPLDVTQAQGQKIVCQLSSNFFQVPPLKTRVLVAIPEPGGTTPGAATVLMAVDPRGTQIYAGTPGDLSLVSLSSFAQLLLAASGSASIQTKPSASGAQTALTVNPDGTATLAGADAAIAMSTKIDAFINLFVNPTSPFTPSPQETAFAQLITALTAFSGTYWTPATTGSSKVKAAQ